MLVNSSSTHTKFLYDQGHIERKDYLSKLSIKFRFWYSYESELLFACIPHVASSHVAPINGHWSHRIRKARRTLLHKHQMDPDKGAPNNAAVKTKTDQLMDQWTACGPDFHCICSTQQPIAHVQNAFWGVVPNPRLKNVFTGVSRISPLFA